MMTNKTFSDQLDELANELTGLVLQADELADSAPPALLEMTNLARVADLLDHACGIVEEAQALAMLDESVDDS